MYTYTYIYILKKYYEALQAIILQLIISDSCVFHLIKEHTVWKLVRFEPFHTSPTYIRKEETIGLVFSLS